MLTEKEILEFLEIGENQYIEFKKAEHKFPINALETISAFANTNKGYILLGIEENKKNTVVGVSSPKKIIKELFNHMNNSNEISRNVINENNVYELKIDNKDIVVIEVPCVKYTNKPIYLKNNPFKSYIRQGDGDFLANKETVEAMLRDSDTESYDSKIIENYTIDDLDEVTIQNYRNLFKRIKPDHPFNSFSNIKFLEKINVLKKDRKFEKYFLTVAGLLVFGKHESIKEYIPHYNIEYIRKSSFSEKASFSDRIIYDGTWGEDNLYNFFFVVFEKLKNTINSSSKITEDNLIREDNSKLIIAIREALINTIIHCDFFSKEGIKVIRYSDKILFINGGSLRIDLQDFFSGGHSDPRNYYIQEIFRLINVCEKAGTGIPKIMEAVKDYNLKKPDVVSKVDSFEFILWDTSLIENLKLSNVYEKQIINYLIKNKICNRNNIELELKISKTTANKYLNNLINKNIIVRDRLGKKIIYTLNDKDKNLEKYNLINSVFSLLEELKRN